MSHLKKNKKTEAVVQMCTVKKVFLKILRNSQENNRAKASFLIHLQAWGLQLNLKRDSGKDVFLWVCEIFKKIFF